MDEPCTLLVPQYTGPPLSVQQYILAADPDWPAFVGAARLALPLRWLPVPLLATLAAGSCWLEAALVSSLTRAPRGTVAHCLHVRKHFFPPKCLTNPSCLCVMWCDASRVRVHVRECVFDVCVCARARAYRVQIPRGW